MKKLSTEELIEMQERQEQFTLINVLPADQFSQTEIPGSENISLHEADFATRVQRATGGKDRTVIVYCGNEQCTASTEAAARLAAAGFSKVYDYKGGAREWYEHERRAGAKV
jgi:rhodanese-related sulfurtransferase